MKKYNSLIYWAISLALGSSAVYAEDLTQIDRYSTVQNKPTLAQVNPLLAVSEFKFPASVKTVGQAIRMVLSNTGYELVASDHLSASAKDILEKPLPLTDRQLGPLSIKKMLTVLMGTEVFSLVVDPLHRRVNFEMKPAMSKLLGVHHGNRPKKYRLS
jgi:type IV pili sensor histidine kinase/response regulator